MQSFIGFYWGSWQPIFLGASRYIFRVIRFLNVERVLSSKGRTLWKSFYTMSASFCLTLIEAACMQVRKVAPRPALLHLFSTQNTDVAHCRATR